jgi:hypothetical protein
MSFVYNNKLPFYVWGDLGNPFNFLKNYPEKHWTNPHYQLKSRRVHLSVPLPEDGPRKSWENKSVQDLTANQSIAVTSDFEGVPCDAQMPWKMFQNGSEGSVWGLTIHGEVYCLPANLSFSWVDQPPEDQFWSFNQLDHAALCRMSRWSSATLTKAIQAIFQSKSLYPNSIVAIDKDGDAWWLHDWRRTTADILAGNIGDSATSIQLPAGKQAQFVTFGNFATGRSGTGAGEDSYLVTTTENKTYIRRADQSQWYALTGGCVEILNKPNLDLYQYGWLSNDLPTATVSESDDENGVTAEVSITFGAEYVSGGNTYKPLASIKIDNTGEGYSEDATVTFSRAPDSVTAGAPALDFKLKPWLNWVTDYISTGPHDLVPNASPTLEQAIPGLFSSVQVFSPVLLDNAGKQVLALTTPLTDNNWLYSGFRVFTDLSANPDESTAVPAKRVVVCPTATQLFAFAISNDGKLYKQLGNAFRNWELVSSDSWVSLASSVRTFCGVKSDGSMWTWGRNSSFGDGEFEPKNFNGVYFGDGSALDAQRTSPTQIAAAADWVSVWPLGGGGFIAIRKDAICRDIDQPMEYWPDWHFGG